jgi:hypothetical protein
MILKFCQNKGAARFRYYKKWVGIVGKAKKTNDFTTHFY